MCGFTAFIDIKNQIHQSEYNKIINKMCDEISHRGPDEYNYYINKNVVLGHRRLSIQDFNNGTQPFLSKSGQSAIIFNGEIYNHKNLRDDFLNDFDFKTNCDTETLIEFIEKFGFEQTHNYIKGMFAFVYFNFNEKYVIASRDHLGKKPLYYGINNEILYFGSQIKSFYRNPKWQKKTDLNSVQQFLNFGYIPSGYSIEENIFKLEPGHYIKIEFNGMFKKKIEFCKIENSFNKIRNEKVNTNTIIKQNLLTAINKRIENSDFEVGAFLSGGTDSTLVSCLAHSINKKIKTFSIGFYEKEFNEAHYSKRIAKMMGFDHYEYYLSVNELINYIDEIPKYYDEPFADSSQLPTLIVSKFASEHVKVILSGDGGDELFGGYPRYELVNKVHNNFFFNSARHFYNLLEKLNLFSSLKNFHKVSSISKVKLDDLSELYFNTMTQWNNEEMDNKKNNFFQSNLNKLDDNLNQIKEKIMFIDQKNYLPDDILTKVDRASMAYGLEARTPFLDIDFVNFVNNLPFKFKDGINKDPLKSILLEFLPYDLVYREKMGFGIPIDELLKNKKMKERLYDLSNSKKIRDELSSLNLNNYYKYRDDYYNDKINIPTPIWFTFILFQWIDNWR